MVKKLFMYSVILGLLVSVGTSYAANSQTTKNSDNTKTEFKRPPQMKDGETPPEPPKDANGNPMKPPQDGNFGQQRPPMDMNGNPPEPPKDANGNPMKSPENNTNNNNSEK